MHVTDHIIRSLFYIFVISVEYFVLLHVGVYSLLSLRMGLNCRFCCGVCTFNGTCSRVVLTYVTFKGWASQFTIEYGIRVLFCSRVLFVFVKEERCWSLDWLRPLVNGGTSIYWPTSDECLLYVHAVVGGFDGRANEGLMGEGVMRTRSLVQGLWTWCLLSTMDGNPLFELHVFALTRYWWLFQSFRVVIFRSEAWESRSQDCITLTLD